MTDTIAAIATATGVGGVGIIRLSGPRAIAIVASLLGLAEDRLGREVHVGWIRDADGSRVDQVLAFAMRAPASFTGEDVAEIHGHGGARNLSKLLAMVMGCGARVAEPGEFTRRAVEHGKLDLLRAEALLGVIHAGSERAWRLAQRNLAGRLGDEVVALEHRNLALLAEIEGRIDFPEEDLEPASAAWIVEQLGVLAEACIRLVDGFRHGRVVDQGITVALVGAVNVGKSSLLNALVGTERALVAAEPGTTRDYLEAHTEWDGVTVTLVDTAGTRETADAVERRGIVLGEARVAAADVVVVVNDGAVAWNDGTRYGERALLVRSKVDLRPSTPSPVEHAFEDSASIPTSATTGEGLAELRTRVLALAGVADREGNEQPFVTTARQHDVMVRAREAFVAARTAWHDRRPSEVIALELRSGAHALAQLRGVEVGERVLDEVFARFCIGK